MSLEELLPAVDRTGDPFSRLNRSVLFESKSLCFGQGVLNGRFGLTVTDPELLLA